LLCGDSTAATDVERVLGGVEPHRRCRPAAVRRDRILAARQLGIAEIPVMVAAGWERGAKARLRTAA
jgi:hypothetical protein